MNKRLRKTASGTVLNNSSPAAVEEVLVGEIKHALGKWSNAVKVKPFLQIDESDPDLSNNVKNAFGAMELDVYGIKLYIPFIIADKTLLPFDTIRMGDDEIAYDRAKLQRVVNAIEHKAKRKEELGEDDVFQTMEVAKFDDIPLDNGFLGTIMNIRDSHKAKDVMGDDPYMGPDFGLVDMERAASEVDVLETFHDVMEKMANIKVYSKEQLESFEEHIRKKAEQEFANEFEKTATAKDTLEKSAVEREMSRLSEERLFNVHRAASGNNIAFPVHDDGQIEYRMGRVYRNFDTLVQSGDNDYESGKIAALILDSKGGYCFLNEGSPFMASTNPPSEFELPTELARGMEANHMYTFEKNTNTLYNPFIVERSYLQNSLNDGIVISVRERATDGNYPPSRTINSLFYDVMECKEAIPGKSRSSNFLSSWSKPFSIVVSRDANFTEPVVMDEQQIQTYITQHAKDPVDAQLAKNMLMFTDTYVLMPSDFSLFKMEKSITNFYTRPDGLFKEGPLAKTAAACDDKNKATLYLRSQREPKVYAIEWNFTRQADAGDGVEATKLERRRTDGLTKDQAETLLHKLGYDYRTQARFFEIAHRNGRSATFRLPNPKLAAKAAVQDKSDSVVKQKMKHLADSLLDARGFMPIFQDTIGNAVAQGVSAVAPASIDVAKNVGEVLGMKEAEETASNIEKVATEFNGATWHELSAMLNLKYRIDKVATELLNGNYLYNAEPVFEKVAELKPTIKKKASDLIEFNRKQLLNTSSSLVRPSLIKQAIEQLDGLYTYASLEDNRKKRIEKKAGLFRESDAIKFTSQQINNLKKALNKTHNDYDYANAKLRAAMQGNSNPNKVNQAFDNVKEVEDRLHEEVETLNDLYKERGTIKQQEEQRNLAIIGGVGLPGLFGASYGYESAKDND